MAAPYNEHEGDAIQQGSFDALGGLGLRTQARLATLIGVSSAETAIQNAQLAAIQTLIADMASDLKITPSEKKVLYLQWLGIEAEQPIIGDQCDEAGIAVGDAVRAAYLVAYGLLYDYLMTSPGIFIDMDITSDVVPSELQEVFDDYYGARQTLMKIIARERAPKYIGKYSNATDAGHPAIRAYGDWWLIYGTSDTYSIRGLYYDNLGTPTRLSTDLGAWGMKFMAAMPDIGWAIGQGYGTEETYGDITYFTTIFALAIIARTIMGQEIEVLPGGRLRYYNGQGVQKRCVELAQDDIGWIDTPDTIPASDELLRGRIGRLGVGETILIDGDFRTTIDSQWSTPTTINAVSTTSTGFIILADGTRRVAYYRTSDTQIVERIDTGSGWGAEIPVSGSSFCTTPEYTQLPSGEVRMAYNNIVNSNLVYRVLSGSSWGPEEEISDSVVDYISLVSFDSGDMWAVYARHSDGYLIVRKQVRGIWGTEEELTQAVSMYPSAIAYGVTCRVAYRRSFDAVLVEKVWDGAIWSEEDPIGSGGSYPSYMKTIDNDIWIVYRSANSVYRVNHGGVWGDEQTITTTASIWLRIAQAQNGTVYFICRNSADGYLVERTLRRYARIGAGIIEEGTIDDRYADYRIYGNGLYEEEGVWTDGVVTSSAANQYADDTYIHYTRKGDRVQFIGRIWWRSAINATINGAFIITPPSDFAPGDLLGEFSCVGNIRRNQSGTAESELYRYSSTQIRSRSGHDSTQAGIVYLLVGSYTLKNA